jgi:hypothetical protein
MKNFRAIGLALGLALAAAMPARAQVVQLPAGYLWGNPTGTAAQAQPTPIVGGTTAILGVVSGNFLGVTSGKIVDSGIPMSAGAVTSVFGRTGVVTAQANDYSFSQLSGQIAAGQIPNSTITSAMLNFVPGTVTSISAGCGSTTGGSAITTSGTLSASEPVDAAGTGSNYAIPNADCGNLVKLSNASAQTPTLAQAGTGGNFPAGWFADVCNIGAGTQTLTPATSTIDGAASLAIAQKQCFRVVSDGTNYQLATRSTSVSNSDGTLTISPIVGSVVASLNLAHSNTWSVLQTFATLTVTGSLTTNLTGGGTQCVQASNTGVLSGTGSACGSGSGAVNSVTNSDGTLTISPTTGSVVASLNLAHTNGWTVAQSIASASATAFAVGLNGATNPAFNVDASTASMTAGLNVKGAGSGGTVALSLIDSGTNTNLTINAKGSGTIGIGNVSTGAVTITPALTLSAALTYGGVTLSNSVAGTGSMVLATSPTLVTPVLGVAAGTSLALGGCTIGSNTLCAGLTNLTGNVTVTSASFGLTGNISAAAWTTNGIRYKNIAATLTDTSSSGTVAAIYNDVWGGNTNAASSATVYTNAYGSYYKVPVAGTNVTFTNAYALGADSISTTSLLIGGITGSTQCLHVSTTGLVSGTGSDCGSGGGSTLTANSSPTSGFTAGQLLYSDGTLLQASGGVTWAGTGHLALAPAVNTSALTVTSYSLTGSSAVGMMSLTGTLNTSGAGDVFALNITVTSANSMKLFNLYGGASGTTSKFSIDVFGGILTTGAINGAPFNYYFGSTTVGNSTATFSNGYVFGFASSTNPVVQPDTMWSRGGAAATWQSGGPDAAAPVPQFIQAQSVVAGTSNTAGVNWTHNGSRGTGTGAGGNIIFQISLAGTTGTSQNSLTPALTILNTGSVQLSYTTTYASCTALTTNASGTIGCTVSAARFKNIIGTIMAGNIELPDPTAWTYKDQNRFGAGERVGLIADDVVRMDNRCAVYDPDGQLKNYDDRCFTAYMVAVIKQQRIEIDDLKRKSN